MMDLIVFLAPGLALQWILLWAMLGLFRPKTDQGPAALPPLIALACVGLSIGIEWGLAPYLLQVSLVLQWGLFVLLGHKFCGIPLAKSMLAQFCAFALLLGSGLLEAHRGHAQVTDEERELLDRVGAHEASGSGEIPAWARKIEAGFLPNRLVAVRRDFQDAVYGDPPDPGGTPVATPPATDPAPFAAQATPPVSTPVSAPATAMSGAEFEALVYSGLPPLPPPDPGGVAAPPPSTGPLPVRIPEEPDLMGSPTSITSDQMSELVEVRNRSTDRAYPAPEYEIGAVSMGDNGRFAMVDGRLVREGSILRTGGQDPRGWKLYRVTPTELFWQPLK